jgi:hypothetical protein
MLPLWYRAAIRLILYTDGINEAENEAGDRLAMASDARYRPVGRGAVSTLTAAIGWDEAKDGGENRPVPGGSTMIPSPAHDPREAPGAKAILWFPQPELDRGRNVVKCQL